MAIKGAMRIGVPFETVFPFGAQCLGIQAELDFDKKKEGAKDPQKRDKDTGERVWVVRVADLDGSAFKGQVEQSVKIAAPVQPVPPARTDPVYPPLVWFEGLTLTPYTTNAGRQAYSMRATAVRAPTAEELELIAENVAAAEAAVG